MSNANDRNKQPEAGSTIFGNDAVADGAAQPETAVTMEFTEAPDSPGYESASEEENVPVSDIEQNEQSEKSGIMERILGIATSFLAALLLLGSLVFWWYFSRKLAISPVTIINWKLYEALLICCAVTPLVFAVTALIIKKRAGAETWLIGMCASGAVSAAITLFYNTVILQNTFSWSDIPTMFCFAISGCALPTALFLVAGVLIDWLVRLTKWESRKNWELVKSDVLALCPNVKNR